MLNTTRMEGLAPSCSCARFVTSTRSARINRLAAKLPEREAEAWDKELHIYAYPDDGFAELRASFSLADTIRADGEGGLVV